MVVKDFMMVVGWLCCVDRWSKEIMSSEVDFCGDELSNSEVVLQVSVDSDPLVHDQSLF